ARAVARRLRPMQLRVAGENALLLEFGQRMDEAIAAQVAAAVPAIEHCLGADLDDLIPSYASVLILFDALATDHLSVARRVRRAVAAHSAQRGAPGNLVVLPVYYAPEAGADLDALAARAQLSIDDVIALHSGAEYR